MVNTISTEHRELFRDVGNYLRHCANGPERDRVTRIVRDSLAADEIAGLFRVLLDAALDGDQVAADVLSKHLPPLAEAAAERVAAG